MAKTKSTAAPADKRTPKVRIARPAQRPYQIRYTDPHTGKEARYSVGSRSERDAARLKREIEAKLLLGLQVKPRQRVTGPEMLWSDFRESYSQLQLSTLRPRGAESAESRLDIAERILNPRRLSDIANGETLHYLQSELLSGVASRFGRPRSPHTVKTYIGAVTAALNWACLQGWLPSVPRVRTVRVSRLKQMKGRPITTEEFERMLAKTTEVVGEQVADSWRFILRGCWASALRIEEIMNTSWDIEGTIRPVWQSGRLPVLFIPAELQKNDTEESIPLLPWFEELLAEVRPADRQGWIFNPRSLQQKYNRPVRTARPRADWVAKVISRIGKKAGVVVDPGNQKTGKPAKFASAHDLRRSCSERLLDAGVPPLEISRVLRHASWETTRRHYAPGDVQKAAGVLRQTLCGVR